MQRQIIAVALIFVSNLSFAEKDLALNSDMKIKNYIRSQIESIEHKKELSDIFLGLKALRLSIDEHNSELNDDVDKAFVALRKLKNSNASKEEIVKAQAAYEKADDLLNTWSSYKIVFKKIFISYLDKDSASADCVSLKDDVKLLYVGNNNKQESSFPSYVKQAVELLNFLCKLGPNQPSS